MVPALRRFSCLILLWTGSCAFCAVRPSFNLDYSAWHSTHIVVVTPVTVDGRFRVLDSWKGDLQPGEIIIVPELVPDADAVSLTTYPDDWSSLAVLTNKIPAVAFGSHMVLYLKQDSTGVVQDGVNLSRWSSSSILAPDMKASVVWIQNGRPFGFVQIMNPGDAVLIHLSYLVDSKRSYQRYERLDESSLKDTTFNVLGIQQHLSDAASIADLSARAEALKPYVDSKIHPAKMFALEELGKCGEAALPTIRAMLDDPKFVHESSELVEQYAKAGGSGAGPELTARLRGDLTYWQIHGPTLPVGWWNNHDSWADEHDYHDRYGETVSILRALDRLRYAPAIATAIQLRDFWRSLPQLNDPSGINGVITDADQLVTHVQGKELGNRR